MTDHTSPAKLDAPPAPEAGRRVLIKGQQTKAVIIDAALGLASQMVWKACPSVLWRKLLA